MKKVYLLFIFSLFFGIVYSQDLPNYMTDYEKQIYPYYVPPAGNEKDINPPFSNVRTIGEWEENQAVMITWTSYQAILAQMVKYIAMECKCLIICSDSNSVKTQLTNYGVPLTNLKFLIASFNSVWCRDYGQWCAYKDDVDSLKFIDWIYNRPRPLDDQIPVYVSQLFNVPLHQTTSSPNNFIATGGNFMTDGHGTAFSSKLILNENPSQTESQIDTIVKKYMGIKRYIKMNTLPYDGIHHIDMHMKLLDEETIMVGQYPAGVSDGPQIELNLQYILNNFLTCYGKPYKVVRIPMPPSSSGQYPPNSSYFTYTNSLIVNKTVLVPIYGFAQDTTALRIYRDAMPGYKVIGIDCNASIPASGAIHCISKDIAVYEPLWISHSGLRDTNNTLTPYQIKALIKAKSGISNAKLYWTTDTTAGYTQVNMTQTLDTFKAVIPAQSLNTKIYYYISATSNNSKALTKPMTAPSGYFKFQIRNATNIGNENELPYTYNLSQNYPNPFNPLTSIRYSIPKTGLVTIKVYDILGREIYQLINEIKQPGEHFVNFDASYLSSGIYFYTLSAGNYTATKKMMVVK